MLNTKKQFSITCDRCGDEHIDFNTGLSWFDDEESARMSAADDGWIEIGKRHYCPNCYDMSNNIDEPKLEENE